MGYERRRALWTTGRVLARVWYGESVVHLELGSLDGVITPLRFYVVGACRDRRGAEKRLADMNDNLYDGQGVPRDQRSFRLMI